MKECRKFHGGGLLRFLATRGSFWRVSLGCYELQCYSVEVCYHHTSFDIGMSTDHVLRLDGRQLLRIFQTNDVIASTHVEPEVRLCRVFDEQILEVEFLHVGKGMKDSLMQSPVFILDGALLKQPPLDFRVLKPSVR